MKNEEDDNKLEIDYYNYCYFYNDYAQIDIKSLPLVTRDGNDKIYMSYDKLRQYLIGMKKDGLPVEIFDSKKDYMKRVGRSFTKRKGISYNKKEKTIAFQESITDKQQLSVKLQIYYPEKKNDPCYEVIKWKKEAVGVWKKDGSLPVYRNK